MNVNRINAPRTNHVRFNEQVEVRSFDIERPSLGTSDIQPSLHAQRLERSLRAVPAQSIQQPQVVLTEQAQQEQPQRTKFQKFCGIAAISCFAAALASISLFFIIGPVAVAAVAGFAILSVAFEGASGIKPNNVYYGP